MSKTKRCAYLLSALLFLQTPALAWGDNGHMTVAQIAFNNLTPQKRERAAELAALVAFEDNEYEFVTAACWMDDIRDAPMFEPLKDWHFITQRFIVPANSLPDAPPPIINAASVIDWLVDHLRHGEKDPDLKKAFYLAELIHLTGDIHQPLHGTTRFTPDMPDGDRGGNLFLLSEDAPRANLHSYWDAGGMLFGNRNVRRPLSDSGRKSIEKFARDITQVHPKSSMTAAVNQHNPMEWAKESFKLGKDVVYVGVKEGTIPDDTYQKKVQETARRRVALAGYRLAAILNEVL